MKAYILRADHLYNTMTLVESGVSTTLEYEERDNKDIFIGVEPDDMVMGYVAAPISMVKSVFKVTEVVSKSKVVFEKVIEANVGPALPEALEQRIQMKDFIEITTLQFEELYSQFANMITSSHHSAVNDDKKISTEIVKIGEEDFVKWLATQKKSDGSALSAEYQTAYYYILKAIPSMVGAKDIFSINTLESFDAYDAELRNGEAFKTANPCIGAGTLSAAISKYRKYLEERTSQKLSVEELTKELKIWYSEKPVQSNATSSLVGFGLKYGHSIRENKISSKKLLELAQIDSTMGAYIDRGVDLYYTLKDGKIGMRFVEKAAMSSGYSFDKAIGKGENLVIYGTPGCGKSYYVMHDLLMEDQQEKNGAFKKDHIFRTTFYQDYTNTDFVGQVMPVVQYQKDESGAEKSIVTYKFVPGPFTLALECAIANPTEKVALVIEELNRGNAASIFGDLFQLLDRVSDGEKSDFTLCTSEYGILNVNIVAYLKDCEHYDKKYKYSFDLDEIRIPANLYIYATMNTSDQNVYTLDTAFKRRWGFEKLKNIFKDNHDYADYLVPGMLGITWKQLVTDINMFIVSDSNMLAAEDKQIGVYFIDKNLFIAPNTELSAEEVKKRQEKFAYKLFEYLWDDVAKFSHDRWFGKIKTLDELIDKFMNGEKVFVDGIINQKDQ